MTGKSLLQLGRRLLWGGALVLVVVWLAGCSDKPPAQDEEADVTGKTPVVRPEDVHRRGAGGSAVLAPDYLRDLHPDAEASAEVAAGSSRQAPGAAAKPAQTQPAATIPTVSVPPDQASTAQEPAVTPAVATATPVTAGKGFPVPGCRQLVLVVAPDFKAKHGTLRRLVRDGGESPWREDSPPLECLLGRGGLGVGRGLWSGLDGPAKRPGDGRTPAGLFTLSEAFGTSEAQAAQAAGVRLPYQTVSDRLACVTDPETPLFGRLAGAEERAAAHVAHQDRMQRSDGANVWGVVIGHNRDNPDPAAGSCLFVNVRQAGGSPTGGSIGLPEAAAASLVTWLDPAAGPLLAVLPQRDYQTVKKAWGLP
jgi:L,D-peptidoglycan transpeptidase YkuD (ErfK/YbiS/YcfS/YnhG family)